MYELIIANKNYSSWSMRPWVLMRALQIPFGERLLLFHANSGAGDFRMFSPTGRVPCLLDGPVKVWDSLAIVEYLAERHAGVWPQDLAARAWARSAAAEMHSGFQALRTVCSMNVGLRVRLHQVSPPLQAELLRLNALWSEGLNSHGGPWLAGKQFGAVDAFFAPVATRLQTYGLSLPQIAAQYAQRLLDFAPVSEWVNAGINEPWRDAAHEAEVLEHGEITLDQRAAVRQA
ncbi:MAG: glutathione S-transferase family protein [Steroidobacteraceae bacterium]